MKNSAWDIQLQKTGYIREAGKCVVMLVTIASKPFVIVLLDSLGKYTRIADAQRVKHWLETGESLVIAEPKSRLSKAGKRVHGSFAATARQDVGAEALVARRVVQARRKIQSRPPQGMRSARALAPMLLEQLACVRASLRRDLAARQHSRELVDARAAGQLRKLARHAARDRRS